MLDGFISRGHLKKPLKIVACERSESVFPDRAYNHSPLLPITFYSSFYFLHRKLYLTVADRTCYVNHTRNEYVLVNQLLFLSFMVKIVGISGSLRAGSYSQLALKVAAERAVGAEVEILDLRSLKLPFCNGENDYIDYPDVDKLQNAVKQADGLILATPEYHGSVSGSQECPGFDEF